eukprot:721948-Lingulodinium_polyedra.AAC.1
MVWSLDQYSVQSNQDIRLHRSILGPLRLVTGPSAISWKTWAGYSGWWSRWTSPFPWQCAPPNNTV